MVTCRDFAEAMYPFAAKELPAARQEEFQRHLDGCAACRQALAEYQRVTALAKQIPDLPVPRALLDRFRDALHEEMKSSSSRRTRP
jgi:anti-sigma factor RsiW